MASLINKYWPLFYVALVFIGIGYGLAKATQTKTERRRILALLDERDLVFNESFAKGRKWLSDLIAEARSEIDTKRELGLRYKKHPAYKSADIVQEIGREKRILQSRVTFLEYQLKSYEEYFPFLEEYRDAILDERATMRSEQDNIDQLESTDPVKLLLEPQEYEKLSSSERNQLALDRYKARPKNNWEIGRAYERYIGYCYETRGWKVFYQGAIKGYEDFGRDLICVKNGVAEIVQAKCWSKDKVIREKHVFQLFGTVILYKKSSRQNVTPVFICTTNLSAEAKDVADALSVRIEYLPFTNDYPMIKCNISQASGEKIYHLPFDQQYDKVQISEQQGKSYVVTAKQAEDMGFRRAWKYLGETTSKSKRLSKKR